MLPPANEVWGKVICLQVCVCPQGGCRVPQGGCLVLGGLLSGGPGGDPPPGTATAAIGTHPTGMHSCSYSNFTSGPVFEFSVQQDGGMEGLKVSLVDAHVNGSRL